MIPHIGVQKYASAHKPIAYIHTPNYVYFYAYVDKEISITHTQIETRTHMYTHTHTQVQMVQRPQRTDSVNAILKDEMSICNRCVPQYRQKRDKISTPIFRHKYIETGFCRHTHTHTRMPCLQTKLKKKSVPIVREKLFEFHTQSTKLEPITKS